MTSLPKCHKGSHNSALPTVAVRRFEPGASGFGLDEMLQAAGYSVLAHGAAFRVWRTGKGGRPELMSRAKLIALLDRVRMSKGLEPIVKAHALTVKAQLPHKGRHKTTVRRIHVQS